MSRDSYPILVLGGIICALLIFFFLYSMIVSQIVKRKDRRLEEEMKEIVKRIRLESLIIISYLNELNHSELLEFKPSIGTKKISDIQARAKQVIRFFFTENRFFRSLLLLQEELEDLGNLITLLETTKSNIWKNRLMRRFFKIEKELLEEKINMQGEYIVINQILRDAVKEIYWTTTEHPNLL